MSRATLWKLQNTFKSDRFRSHSRLPSDNPAEYNTFAVVGKVSNQLVSMVVQISVRILKLEGGKEGFEHLLPDSESGILLLDDFPMGNGGLILDIARKNIAANL